MGFKNEMTRKEFLVLTFTLIGSSAAIGNCDDDDDNNNTTGLGGRGGTTGTGGSGTAGRGGSGGTSTGGNGTGGTSTGGNGTGGNGAAACADPLREMQLQDSTGHTHSVTIAASTLSSTTAQTFPTSVAVGHQHNVTLQPADLSALASGGSVTVVSSIADLHAHMYAVSCH
jgi:hypothetical protein